VVLQCKKRLNLVSKIDFLIKKGGQYILSSKKEEFKNLIKGPVVVVFTPFDRSGKYINEEQYRKNIRYMVDNGIRNNCGVLIPGGSTGDCYVMTTEERKKVFKLTIEEAKGEVPVICGVNHTSTDTVIELSQYAEKIGANGVMATPPYYWINPSDEAIFSHYRALSDSINIGIMIYNNSNIINKDLSIDLLDKLASLKNVLALKECSPDRVKYKRVFDKLNNKLVIINGAGEWTEPNSYKMGTKAYISGFANFLPSWCVEIHKSAISGNFEKVEMIIDKLKPLQNILYSYVNEYGGAQEARMYKEMADLAGFPQGKPRLPILEVPKKYRDRLKDALGKVDLLKK